jgi:DNA-binding IclR family transcriptional regulator
MNQLARALDLLELLAERGEMRLSEVTAELGTSRATAFRLLAALQARGYVDHVRDAHTYRLGIAIQALASRSNVSTVVRLAGPALGELRSSTGETANLAVVNGGRIIYALTLDGRHVPRMPATVGQEAAPHATALGKAIVAAFKDEHQRESVLGPPPYRSYTDRTLVDREALMDDLRATTERGYAVDDNETDVGAVCIAAPILDGEGVPIAAISIAGVPDRLPEESRPLIGRRIRQWCDDISTKLAAPKVTKTAGG